MPWLEFFVTLPNTLFQSLSTLGLLRQDAWHQAAKTPKEFQKSALQLLREIESQQPPAFTESILIRWLELCQQAKPVSAPASTALPGWLLRVKRNLESQLGSPLHMKSLFQEAGISYEHGRKIFRQHFHLSPQAYRHRQKMLYAEELLRSDELTIAAISQILGYADRFAFSRQFKRHASLPPKRYAKAIKQ